jgi:SAM-dependent methyltransferase
MEKRYSEACERNKDPILEVLRDVLPAAPRVLEIGSGTGQHAVYFSHQLDGVEWQPSDLPGRLGSVRARYRETDRPELREPIALDLFGEDWDLEPVDAIVAINVLHIAPWKATERLFARADALLDADGLVYLYGPFRYEDHPLEPSNQRFHAMLQSRDPTMGLRVVGDVEDQAAAHDFELARDEAMPANNRSLVWRRPGRDDEL